MKNTWRTFGTLSLGVALAFGMTNSVAKAAEPGTSTEVKEDSKLVDINLPKLPILGEVKVSIPSTKSDEENQSLISLEVNDGILDELNVDVGAKSETAEGGTKKSLATVEVKSSITNDVTVDVAAADENDSAYDGGLVEVNAEDLPLLGETHVGIIDKHVKDGENKSVSSGLAQVDVNGDLLEDTSVQVLATDKTVDADGDENSNAVADVSIGGGILDGIVDEADVSVLKRSESEKDGTQQSKSSIASVGLESDLTEDVQVDVGLDQEQTDGNTTASDAGLVEVNPSNLPLLGETHVGVLDKHVENNGENTSVSSGLAQVDIKGDLLDDTSVKVLASEKEASADATESMSAVAGVNLGGGILEGIVEDLDVSVLKKEYALTGESTTAKSSIISIGLDSPLTEDVQVDVGSAQSQSDDGSMSFDGGLVDVNASDLPLLGETHIGVLDKHVNVNEDGLSFGTGLVQVGLDGDLIEESNVNVLYKNGEMTEDGLLVTNGVVGTDLALVGIDPITVDIVKTEKLYPISAVTPPSTGGGDGDDDGNTVPPTVIVPIPGGNGNEDGNTVPPTVIEPVPDGGNIVPPTVIVPVPGGNGNEDGNTVPPTVIVPVPGDEDDSSTGNGNGTDGNENSPMNPDSNEDGTTVVPGDGSGTPSSSGDGEVDADSDNRENGTVDGTMPGKNQSTTKGGKQVLSASVIKEAINSQPTRGSLPQTGRIFDGKRLAVLAVLLLISGAGLRKFGRSGQPAA